MDDLKDIRWKQRFNNYEKSYQSLEKYADQITYTELEQAGLIQMFEVCFELAWKVMKDYLEAEGFKVDSPRETIKKGFELQLIDDGEAWIEALNSRNMTVHTYDEEKAREMVEYINEQCVPLLEEFYLQMKEKKE